MVPFRLTSHMVDGFGVTGYEGIFRRVMEVTLNVLRENQETLISVLEPFLQDPTVGWERQGRAQRSDDSRKRATTHDMSVDSKHILATVVNAAYLSLLVLHISATLNFAYPSRLNLYCHLIFFDFVAAWSSSR